MNLQKYIQILNSFEKVLRYLPPMMNQLTVSIMVIGLEPFETFRIDKDTKEIVKI